MVARHLHPVGGNRGAVGGGRSGALRVGGAAGATGEGPIVKRKVVAAMALALGFFTLSLAGMAVPDRIRIPKAKEHPPGTPQDSGLFSHWSHGTYRCYSCHPSVFPQSVIGFTHMDMNEGRFCGHCHDGREAKAITAHRCETCHVPR